MSVLRRAGATPPSPITIGGYAGVRLRAHAVRNYALQAAPLARVILSPTRVDGAEMFRAEVPGLIESAAINLNERCSS